MNTNPARRRRVAAALVVVAAAAASAACAGTSSPKSTATQTANRVTMRLIAFRPDHLTVRPGTTVTWSQTDAGVHTVTSGSVVQSGGGVTEMPDGKFDSGPIATGATYQFTFNEPGTYTYFCHIHPATMRGEVRVITT